MNARDVFLLQVKFFNATFINNFAYVAVVVAKENVSLKRYECVISVSSLKIIILLTNKQIFFLKRLVAVGALTMNVTS